MRNIFKDRRAISAILATIMIFGLIMLGLAVGTVILLPFAQQTHEENNYLGIYSGLREMDAVIKDVSQGSGIGATASVAFPPVSGIINVGDRNITITFSDGSEIRNWGYNLGYIECRFLRTYSSLTRSESINLLNPNDAYWWESTDNNRISSLDPTNINLRRGTGADHYLTLSYAVGVQTTTWINPSAMASGTWVEINIILTILQSTSDRTYFDEIPFIYVQLEDYSVTELYRYNDSFVADPSLSLSMSTDSGTLFTDIPSNLVIVREVQRVFSISW
ncbi:MAG: hypothetical protein ACFFBD_00050 [Candidatus Hodarchaeota archaeon]